MLLSPVPEDAFTMQLLYLKLRDPGKSVAWSEGWGTVRIWGTEFAWGHFPCECQKLHALIASIWLLLSKLNKWKNRHTNIDRGKSSNLSHVRRTMNNYGMLMVEELVNPGKNTNWSNTKRSVLKTYPDK